MKHTKECVRSRGAAYKRRHDWERRFPGHCQHCQGRGVHSTITLLGGPLEIHGLAVQVQAAVCWACLLQGKCPRCQGLTHWEPAMGALYCPECAWKPPAEGLPPLPECSCRSGT